MTIYSQVNIDTIPPMYASVYAIFSVKVKTGQIKGIVKLVQTHSADIQKREFLEQFRKEYESCSFLGYVEYISL